MLADDANLAQALDILEFPDKADAAGPPNIGAHGVIVSDTCKAQPPPPPQPYQQQPPQLAHQLPANQGQQKPATTNEEDIAALAANDVVMQSLRLDIYARI